MKKAMSLRVLYIAVFLGLISACEQDPNDPGIEYAPNMYLPVAYEPYSQTDTNQVNAYGINMRVPAKGTIPRRNYITTYADSNGVNKDLGLMIYNTHKDSIEWAEKTLVNPIPVSKKVIQEGKVLYEYYCQACHGEEGKGNGLVGVKYAGVANLTSGAVAQYNGGHIWHVITHGKGRMWPHASQINPLERWKIVHYVHTLQGQVDQNGNPPAKEGQAKEVENTQQPAKTDSTATAKK